MYPTNKKLTGYKRKGTYKKAPTTKRYAMYKAPKMAYPPKDQFNVKRKWSAGTALIGTDGVNTSLIGLNFSLNDVPSSSDFTALYDSYTIRGVRIQCIPYTQQISTGTGTTSNARQAPIFYAVDLTDDTAPASSDQVLEYNDCKISTVYQGFDIYFKPKFADATSAERDGWVACTNPSLNWYGLKIAIPPTGSPLGFFTVMTYYLSFKDPK